MRKAMLLLGAAALAGCGQSNEAANQVAKAPAKKKAAYCFFKEPDTKGWTATRDEAGDIVVKGKAFRQDPRYKAVLGPATVTGTRAEIAPSVGNNDTGFAAPDNWWDLNATIPNSAAVESVAVTCGAKTLAELKVPPKS